MSDVVFITGSMFAKKSKKLMDLIEVCHDSSISKYLVFKPTKDTRDGLYVRSRVYDRVVPAMAWDQNYSDMKMIFDYTIAGLALTNPDEVKFIFFDEVHFLSKDDVKFIVGTCKKYNVHVVFAGLETSFKNEYFESSQWLRKHFTTDFSYGKCNGCQQENAVHNVLFEDGKRVTEGNPLRPGDQEYKVYCRKCLSTL